MQEIWAGIVEGIKHITVLEAITVITSVLSVYFSMKRNVLVYPFGLIGVTIFIFLAFSSKLYADAGVNIYYFVMSIYGWIIWSKKKDEQDQVEITVNSSKENIISLVILVSSFVLLSQFLIYFTDSDVPYFDATTTAFAIVGMWLMAKRKIENWIAWILTDIISIPLYFHKGLVFISFQFLIFTIMAIAGFFIWKKSLVKKEVVFN